MAELSGMDRSHLSKIENGKIDIPTADVQRRMAEALGLSVDELIVRLGYGFSQQPLIQDDIADAIARAVATWTPRQKALLWQYVSAVAAAMEIVDPTPVEDDLAERVG